MAKSQEKKELKEPQVKMRQSQGKSRKKEEERIVGREMLVLLH